jgi:hypothetical protein
MDAREDFIPTALGSVVTATGYALKQKEALIKWLQTLFLVLV